MSWAIWMTSAQALPALLSTQTQETSMLYVNTHKPPPRVPASSWSCRQAGCSAPSQLERAQSLGDVATIRAAHLGAGQLFSRLAAGKAKCELTPEELGYKGQRSATPPGTQLCSHPAVWLPGVPSKAAGPSLSSEAGSTSFELCWPSPSSILTPSLWQSVYPWALKT